MRHTLLQSRHCRTVVKVIDKPETWTPVQKVATPDGRLSKAQPEVSKVYDETWQIRSNHLVKS